MTIDRNNLAGFTNERDVRVQRALARRFERSRYRIAELASRTRSEDQPPSHQTRRSKVAEPLVAMGAANDFCRNRDCSLATCRLSRPLAEAGYQILQSLLSKTRETSGTMIDLTGKCERGLANGRLLRPFAETVHQIGNILRGEISETIGATKDLASEFNCHLV